MGNGLTGVILAISVHRSGSCMALKLGGVLQGDGFF